MARKIENDKKFYIIRMTVQEAIATMDCFGECNLCGDGCEYGYYIPVINQFYCETCYDAWYRTATRYKSEIYNETKRYNAMVEKLKDLGTWDL